MSTAIRPPATAKPGLNRATISESLTHGVNVLRTITGAPQLEAGVLLAHVLRCTRAHLYAHPECGIDGEQSTSYRALLERRARGEPLPYLTGRIEFFGLDFGVDPRVLIPRPETEALVDLALSILANRSFGEEGCAVVDVGTGSGCIAISLAVLAPRARVYALDISSGALAVARANAQRHGVDQRMAFIQSDLLAPIREQVDLIVANPPYVAAEEWAALPIEVQAHEPRIALDGGARGLEIIRRLLSELRAHLHPGGAFLMEIGAEQGPDVIHMVRHAFPTADVALQADLSGDDRVLRLQQPFGCR